MGKRRSFAGTSEFLDRLGGLLDHLPPQEEKERILGGLGRLRERLGDIEKALAILPTREDAGEAQRAAIEVRRFIERFQDDPLLGPLLRGEPARRPRLRRPAEVAPSTADSLRFLSGLSAEEAERVLASERFAATDVRKIAAALGIPGTSRMTRDSAVHQVVMRLANTRGYKELSTGGHEPPQ